MGKLQRLTRIQRMFLAVAAAAVLALLVAGAALFQPWRLFTSSAVDEAPPAVSLPTPPDTSAGAVAPASTEAATSEAAGPTVVGSGAFQSQEHETSGTAHLLKLADGSQVLRLENLASSDGPDVKVWLSSLPAGGDWFKYRSGRYVDLGAIKATHGNQNYLIPPGTDVAGLTTVVLWCDRFSVAFGSAPLA